MADLISNGISVLSDQEIRALDIKYRNLIKFLPRSKRYSDYLFVVERSLNYIREKNSNGGDANLGSWTIFVIVKLYDKNIITTYSELYIQIDKFIRFYNMFHRKHADSITTVYDRYVTDESFINGYIDKFIKKLK